MKNRKNIWIYSFAVIGVIVMLSGSCKKDEDDPAPQVPVFVVTADSVPLQGGGEGLQFSGKCTNEAVKMTSVTITTPISVDTAIYLMNGASYTKNTSFDLQESNTAYYKELGTWKFNFVGIRTSDNSSFSVNTTLLVPTK